MLLNRAEEIARGRAKAGQSQKQPALLIIEGGGPYLESGPDFMSLAAD